MAFKSIYILVKKQAGFENCAFFETYITCIRVEGLGVYDKDMRERERESLSIRTSEVHLGA